MKKLLAIVLALVCMFSFATATSATAAIYEKASDELLASYNAQIDALIEEIESAESTVEPADGGTAYYVSFSEGDDSNDGLSPQTPWKTTAKVTATTFAEGDVVYFKRGDEWRNTASLKVQNGVSYSAYGEGAKPLFNLSLDASDSSDWEETEWDNIYKYTGTIGGFESNVGAIVFNKGRAWGIHVSGIVDIFDDANAKYAGQRVDNGAVFNGLEFYAVPAHTEFAGAVDLKGNLEFYHDMKNDELYLYSQDGNPAEVFNSVELVCRRSGIIQKSGPATNIVIDNIAIYGAGIHGISFGSVNNVTVQYCTFKWIGGSCQFGAGANSDFKRNFAIRYGNAIESYGSNVDFTMHHNYASQVYDCCWTAQNLSPVTMENLHIYSNVAEYANTGSEVWLGDSKTVDGVLKESKVINMQVHDNYDRYIGYGYSHQRPSTNYPACKADGNWIGAGGFFYGAYNKNFTCADNDVYNNVYMFAGSSAHSLEASDADHFNFHDNTYIMEEGKKFAGTLSSNRGYYTAEHIATVVAKGIEPGTDFYYTKPNPLGNMYELCLNGETAEVQYGDITGDNEITSLDLINIARHNAGWEGYDNIDTLIADVNCDGEVSLTDVIILNRHWAGWASYQILPRLFITVG